MSENLAQKRSFQKLPFCIDGRILDSVGTGVATYAASVRAALAAVGEAPLLLKDQTYGQFGQSSGYLKGIWRRMRANSNSVREVRYIPSERALVGDDIFRLAHIRFLQTGRLLTVRAPFLEGVMHWTYPIPMRIEGWSNIYTVHDVIPLTQPELSSINPTVLHRKLAAIAKHADRIITVSETARRSIIENVGVSADLVSNCGSAIIKFDHHSPLSGVSLDAGGYFLFYGALEHRKNLFRLIEAYRHSGTARPLVIAGLDGDCATELRDRYRNADDIRFVGFLPRPALGALVAGARAVLFPSLVEGFGLPVIEAMALGTPVLTSNCGALAETAGGAAYLVSPTDIKAISAGIAMLDKDDALCRNLAGRGLARAEDFTLDSFGERLCTLYAAVAREREARGQPDRSLVE